MLGAFLAVFVSRGLGFEFGGWLLIHGVDRALRHHARPARRASGSAGALAFPGDRTRLDAAAERRPLGRAG